MVTALIFNLPFELPSLDGLYARGTLMRGITLPCEVSIDEAAKAEIVAMVKRVGQVLGYVKKAPAPKEKQPPSTAAEQAWDTFYRCVVCAG